MPARGDWVACTFPASLSPIIGGQRFGSGEGKRRKTAWVTKALLTQARLASWALLFAKGLASTGQMSRSKRARGISCAASAI
jgi:hypothetical protein